MFTKIKKTTDEVILTEGKTRLNRVRIYWNESDPADSIEVLYWYHCYGKIERYSETKVDGTLKLSKLDLSACRFFLIQLHRHQASTRLL